MLHCTMSLDTTLADITARLRDNAFPNEQAISQGIVLRVLRELGWDTYTTNVVWPEYQTGSGRVDFALCHPPSKPAIFIEVKHVGKAEGAVKQSLEYAFHRGVPFVVLTDGRTWSFYLPAEQGDYEERRVYKLDLYERSPSEAAGALRRYLVQANVASGQSLEAARTEYRNLNRRSQAKATIPEVWQELVQKRNADVIAILVDAVESKVGFPPDAGDVAEFLGAEPAPQPPTPLSDPPPAPPPQLIIRGERYDCSSAKEAMVIVLHKLASSDSSLLERCAKHSNTRGRKRRYIARTLEELYPDREDLRRHHEKLPGGWLVSTNLNNNIKRKLIHLAAEKAGMSPRKDIVLPF